MTSSVLFIFRSGEWEGSCVPTGAPTLNAGPRPLMAARKQLESHDDQLMLIIPVVGRYNTQGYCDR
ncbi:hypothetical protein A2U01_0058672 [Trifolium medium]|uniref:Uncharacterized protein n=1 Tax=Trifolium medium TaxID=97028 RepID=A0A392RLG4_9FABA|nr:hypothetical protein [Trifolium medium]